MRSARMQVYRGRDKQYYWRFIAKNGRQTGDGTEGYKRPSGAVKAAQRHQHTIRTETVPIDIVQGGK